MVSIWVMFVMCMITGSICFVLAALYVEATQSDIKSNKHCLRLVAARALDELKRLQRLICLADQDLVEDLENALKERWE
jgi:hypothetical protein